MNDRQPDDRLRRFLVAHALASADEPTRWTALEGGVSSDIWRVDLTRGGVTRITTDPGVDGYPVWSPDGSKLAFESNRQKTLDLWVTAANGSGPDELLYAGPDSEWPMQWSHDGRFLLYQQSDLGERWDLWALPMTGPDRTPIAVATTRFAERMGQISPDGRWVAYETDESGRPEIVVQGFPEPNGRFPLSTQGGRSPRWSPRGDEICFVALDRKIEDLRIDRARLDRARLRVDDLANFKQPSPAIRV